MSLTLGQVYALSAVEFELWRERYQRRGWASDRVMWTTANAGSAVCATWGGRVKAEEIIPRFRGGGASREQRHVEIRAWLESMRRA